jgi:hypothetical protein
MAFRFHGMAFRFHGMAFHPHPLKPTLDVGLRAIKNR